MCFFSHKKKHCYQLSMFNFKLKLLIQFCFERILRFNKNPRIGERVFFFFIDLIHESNGFRVGFVELITSNYQLRQYTIRFLVILWWGIECRRVLTGRQLVCRGIKKIKSWFKSSWAFNKRSAKYSVECLTCTAGWLFLEPSAIFFLKLKIFLLF